MSDTAKLISIALRVSGHVPPDVGRAVMEMGVSSREYAVLKMHLCAFLRITLRDRHFLYVDHVPAACQTVIHIQLQAGKGQPELLPQASLLTFQRNVETRHGKRSR